MKRFLQLCGILVLAFVLFAISAIAMPHTVVPPQPTPVLTPTPTPAHIIIDERPNYAIIEYGVSTFIIDNNGPLYTFIRFPQGGHSTDQYIAEWAYTFYDSHISEFYHVLETEPGAIGEINMQFDSFLIDNRYVGVFQSGDYSYTLAMPPEEVIKTFNFDLSRGALLDTTDILDYTQTDSIFALLHDRLLIEHPDTGGELEFINEDWLRNLVIGRQGIIVVLERHQLLPDHFPTIMVTLPYEELGSALLIRRNAPLDSVPVPDPVPDDGPDDELEYDDNGYDNDNDDGNDNGNGDNMSPSVPPQSGNIDPSSPMIALTFDDGPGAYTEQLLDLFEMYGVRATFCVIGNLIDNQSESLTRAVEMGSEVIGHSWDHRNMAKLSAEDVRTQIMDTSDAIEAVTGIAISKFRPPFGEVSDTVREVAAELGFVIINWSVDSEDWVTMNPYAIFDSVVHHVDDGSIILSHDTYEATVDAFRRLIPELLNRGFQFVTVSELLYHKAGELTPGNMYSNGY